MTYTNEYWWALVNFFIAGAAFAVFFLVSVFTWSGWLVNEDNPFPETEEDKPLRKSSKRRSSEEEDTIPLHTLPAHDPASESHIHGRYVLESESDLLRLTLLAMAWIIYSVTNKAPVLHEAQYKVECSGYDSLHFDSNAILTLVTFYIFGVYTLPLVLGPTFADASDAAAKSQSHKERFRHAYRTNLKTWEFLYMATVIGVSFVGLALIGLTGRKNQVPRHCSDRGAIQSDYTFGFYIALLIVSFGASLFAAVVLYKIWDWRQKSQSSTDKHKAFYTDLLRVLDAHYLSVWVGVGVNLVFFLGLFTVFLLEIILYANNFIVERQDLPYFPSSSVLCYLQDGLILGWMIYHSLVYFKGLGYEIERWKAKSKGIGDTPVLEVHNVITGSSLLEWMMLRADYAEPEDARHESEPASVVDASQRAESKAIRETNSSLDESGSEPSRIAIQGSPLRRDKSAEDDSDSEDPDQRPGYSCGAVHREGEACDTCDCRCDQEVERGGIGQCIKVTLFGVSDKGCGRAHCPHT
jgi:hypothetical protein